MQTHNLEFDQCPNCGSKRQFMAALTKELKELGYARKEWNFYFDSRVGPVVDKAMEGKIPLGSMVPSYLVYTDICMDCGTIYAVKLVSEPMVKALPKPKLFKPGDLPPGANQPMVS